MPRINDTVRLTKAIPGHGLDEGAVGVVVAEFGDPEEAYEIEFVATDGSTSCQIALKPDQFVVLETPRHLP